jgi:hypothetical protein
MSWIAPRRSEIGVPPAAVLEMASLLSNDQPDVVPRAEAVMPTSGHTNTPRVAMTHDVFDAELTYGPWPVRA